MKDESIKIINRLKRAEGQLRGIQNMIEEDRECVDIITQLSAVRSSIDTVMGMVMVENLQDCIHNPVEDPELQAQNMEKAIKMIIKK